MANPEHLAILKQGVKVWNEWRQEDLSIKPDLRNINLSKNNLEGINFSKTDLRGVNFNNAVLIKADFSYAKFGLNYKLFWFISLAIIIFGIWFYRVDLINVCLIYIIALFYSLFGVVFAFLVNKPYLPQHEKLVSKSEFNSWKYNRNLTYVLKSNESIQGFIANIIHLIYWSLFYFIPLFYFLAWLEPKLRLFAGNDTETILTFCFIFIVMFSSLFWSSGLNIHAFLNRIFFFLIPTTRFINADLTDANFSFAHVAHVDFLKASIKGTNWNKVIGIRQISINIEEPYILKPLILNLILHRHAKKQDLEKVNLSGLNLSETNFEKSKLVSTDLSNANLSFARFINANLTKSQLSGADLTGAILTGSCIEDWKINSKTNLNNVVCDYIYLKQNKQGRYPENRNFEIGEFTKLFQESENIVELVFRHGINWKAFTYAFNESNIQIYNTEGEEIFLREYKAFGDGLIVLKVSIPEKYNGVKIKNDLLHKYQLQIAKLKGELKAKDEMLVSFFERLLLPKIQINQTIPNKDIMFEREQLPILQKIAEKCPIRDSQISESININIHEVRFALNQLQESGFIKLTKHEQSQNPSGSKIDIVLVTEITLEGHLVLKGKIPLNNDISTSSVINNINFGNIGINQMSGGEIKEQAKIAGTINEVNKVEDKNVTELIVTIQEIIEQLEQTYNPNQEQGQKIIAEKTIENINNNHSLAKRLISALEKGGVAWLQSSLISPAASFVIKALEDWQQTKK